MKNAASMGPVTELREPTKLDSLLRAMRGRHSSNPIDKICAIAFPFQKRVCFFLAKSKAKKN